MATATTSASISLSANGTKTAYGDLTWTMPSLPSGATITDISVSGSYSWAGGPSSIIYYVTINGTHVSPRSSFDVSLGASATSPYQISCVGNKRATGSYFSWSGLTITVTYTVPVVDTDKLFVKQNGAWAEVSTAYKRVNGVWVEQTDLTKVFDSSRNYVRGN